MDCALLVSTQRLCVHTHTQRPDTEEYRYGYVYSHLRKDEGNTWEAARRWTPPMRKSTFLLRTPRTCSHFSRHVSVSTCLPRRPSTWCSTGLSNIYL